MLLRGRLARHEHAVQVRGCQLDIVIFVSPSTRLRSQHCAAMNILEVAIRKLVAALAAFGGLVILPQMPSSEFGEAVRCDKLVLGIARRPVVGPIAWLIKHATPVLDHLLRVVIGVLVQFNGHDTVPACFERQRDAAAATAASETPGLGKSGEPLARRRSRVHRARTALAAGRGRRADDLGYRLGIGVDQQNSVRQLDEEVAFGLRDLRGHVVR